MISVDDIAGFLEGYAPGHLAESWDNVGLLVGDRRYPVTKVMTCLTITPASAEEAIDREANLIVTHHPLPFRPLSRLTADTTEGRLLWDLIAARISIYSPHTAFDSAREGINQRLAEGLGLQNIAPLVAAVESDLGSGRWGQLDEALTLNQLAVRVKEFLQIPRVQGVGTPTQRFRRVAVACGSAGEFLGPAWQLGCDCLVTGETRFHTSLEAEATGMGLILAGHFASERFGVERLAQVIAERFPAVYVWASQNEQDPLQWL